MSHQDENGAVIVEFGVIFPVVALLIATSVAFGFIFSIQNTLHHAAREATRTAAITGDEGEVRATIARTTESVGGVSVDEFVICDPDQPGVGNARIALSYSWTGFRPASDVMGPVTLAAATEMRCGG